jgi:hypothetical protein
MERDHLKGASGDAITIILAAALSAEGYRSHHHRQPTRTRQDRLQPRHKATRRPRRLLMAPVKPGFRPSASMHQSGAMVPWRHA